MDTVFRNSKNKKTFDPHRELLNLTDQKLLRRSDVALSNLSICYTTKTIKKSCKNNTLKILFPTWNERFDLTDESYSPSDIQGYFEYITNKHEAVTDNPSIRIYVKRVEKKITFKTGYYLQLLVPKTMKLLESTKNKITKDENSENLSHLEITDQNNKPLDIQDKINFTLVIN